IALAGGGRPDDRPTGATNAADNENTIIADGVQVPAQQKNEPEPVILWSNPPAADGIFPFHDKETGCDYLAIRLSSGSAVTPRLGKDGKPMCGKSERIEA